jgi:hypothetical protein
MMILLVYIFYAGLRDTNRLLMTPLSLILRRVMFRISREPAFFDPLCLFSQFQNRPEAGTSENTENGRQDCLTDETGQDKHGNPDQQKQRPYSLREVIFPFNDDGVENAYNQKRDNSDNQSLESHYVPPVSFRRQISNFKA